MIKTYRQRFYSNYDEIITLKKNKLPILFLKKKKNQLQNDFTEYSEEIQELIKELEEIKDYDQYFVSEELEFSDIALAVLFGACGSFITNSEKLKEFLRLFHDESSEANKFQKHIQKFLQHPNNPIDYDENGKFINRDGGTAKFGFHRLFYGHDILSFKGDNPFQLYAKKFGFLKGIEKAVKHLFADTCSRQGLPLPGSSLFDVKNGNDFTNLMYELSKKVGKGSSSNAQAAFQQLFSYHFQDSLGARSSELLSDIYLKVRGFETNKAKSIFKILTNISEFIINAITGLVKTAGMAPKINWRNVIGLIYQLSKFIGIKLKEHKIQKIEDKYNQQVTLLENCKDKIYKIYKINYLLDLLIMLLLIGFCLLCFINIKTKQNRVKSIVTSNINTSSESEDFSTQIILSETKSFEFRADRRDYVNYDDAMKWCDNIANEIKNRLLINPSEEFLIKGYVADYDNEIDGNTLSLERATNIKNELINRGIPADSLQVKSGGTTNRWGTERKENRAVTIESVVK